MEGIIIISIGHTCMVEGGEADLLRLGLKEGSGGGGRDGEFW